MSNSISGIYDASPKDIYEFIDELIYQNIKNSEHGERKLSGYLFGSPGIGKTQCIEDFPYIQLSSINSSIAQKHVSFVNFSYKRNKVSIEEQSLEQLRKYELEDDVINNIMKEIHLTPMIAVVMASQADIIVPEDISGLPSSQSDIVKLYETLKLINLVDGHSELSLDSYKKNIIGKVHTMLGHLAADDGHEESNASFRNVTRFDMTEWEKNVWDYATKDHIKHVILVLDDITRSANNNPGILNVLMPLLQQYKVGQRELPDNCTVMVTSNESYDTMKDESNYVVELDSAQKDRVFARKVKFRLSDWIEFSKKEKVHDSVIGFVQWNPKYIEDGAISPRRITQFGQSLFNRFGENCELICEDPESNNKFMRVLKLHFGDSRDTNNATILSQFLAFVKNVAKETDEFIKKLLEDGWNDETKAKIVSFQEKGESVKVSIIVHKIKEIMSKKVLNEKAKKNIVNFFKDEDQLMPVSIKYAIVESNEEMLKVWDELSTGRGDPLKKELNEQVFYILSTVSGSVGKDVKDIKARVSKRLKKNNG